MPESDPVSAFPDRRWGREGTRLRELAVRVSCTRLGSDLVRWMAPLDRAVLRRSRGRYTLLGPIAAPVLLLTTTGARSGRPRTTPLLYGRDADRDALIVVGSNFGQPQHPAWSGNLLANPRAVVDVGGTAVPVEAELLTGAEAEAAYRTMVAVARTYDEYRSRTERAIRVFRLTAAP